MDRSSKRLDIESSLVALALACSLTASCAEPDSGQEDKAILSESKNELFLVGQKWPNGVVPMCWSIDPTSPTDLVPRRVFATDEERLEFRRRVREVLENSWPTVANVTITEFGNCVSTNPEGMVELIVEDTAGGAATIGYQGEKGHSEFAIAFHRSDLFNGFLPHEFGHVLGFGHEHDRADFVVPPGWPDPRCKNGGPFPGDTLGTPADVHSVLTSTGYCQDNPVLSPTDVVGAQRAYGVSPRWQALTGPEVFDAEFYLGLYPDLRAAFGDDHDAAMYHWVTYGLRERRRSSLAFDLGYYMSHWSDVPEIAIRAIDHWVEYGIPQCRAGSPEVNPYFYREYYSDLQNHYGYDCRGIAEHFRVFGLSEGRRSSAAFDVGYYLRSYPDLTAAFGSDNYAAAALHWLTFGQGEGRKAHAD